MMPRFSFIIYCSVESFNCSFLALGFEHIHLAKYIPVCIPFIGIKAHESCTSVQYREDRSWDEYQMTVRVIINILFNLHLLFWWCSNLLDSRFTCMDVTLHPSKAVGEPKSINSIRCKWNHRISYLLYINICKTTYTRVSILVDNLLFAPNLFLHHIIILCVSQHLKCFEFK